MLKFEEPVRMQVLHPAFGRCEVRAYCIVDAKMQASMQWPEADWDEMKVAVETKALERARATAAAQAGAHMGAPLRGGR